MERTLLPEHLSNKQAFFRRYFGNQWRLVMAITGLASCSESFMAIFMAWLADIFSPGGTHISCKATMKYIMPILVFEKNPRIGLI
jgi:hypothetical protein